MRTIAEIETRLAALRAELDGDLTPERVAEIRTEFDALKEERKAADLAIETRQKLIEEVQATAVPVAPIEARKATQMFDVESKEYRAAYLRTLMGKPNKEDAQIMERAYATTDTTTAIPSITADKFFEKMKKLAPMMSKITLMRVAGNIKFIAEGARNTATAKKTENTSVGASADTIVSVVLGSFEFFKLIQISKNASNMSVDAFENWLVEMLSGDIARAIDNYIINDSTNGIVAITYTTGTNQILQTATTGYTYQDLVSVAALMPASYDSEAEWLVNKKVLYNNIKKIVDSTGRPIFDITDKTLLGYPVNVDDYVGTSKTEIYLGRWQDIVGNLSQDISVERNDSSGFRDATIDYRGYATFDSKPAKTDAIVRLVSTTV